MLQEIEEALRESDERYKILVDGGLFGVIIHDDGPFFITEKASEMWGYDSPEEMAEAMQGDIRNIFAPEYRENMKEKRALRYQTKETSTVEMEGLRKDGIRFPIMVSISVVPWKEAPRKMAIQCSYLDLTEINIERKKSEEARRKAHEKLEQRVQERTLELRTINRQLKHEIEKRKLVERELRKSERRYRMLFEKAGDAIFIIEAEGEAAGKIIDVNQTAVDMYGHFACDLINQSLNGFDVKNSAEEASGGMDRILKGGWITEEIEHRKKDGTIFPVEIRSGLLEIENHKLCHVFVRDITESKEVERRLIQNEKMATLGLLTAGIAHEINNPNSFITFNIPILRRYVTEMLPALKTHTSTHPDFKIAGMYFDAFREDILELVENIEHGSSRINKTVANLRPFARRKDKIERSWVEVRDVIEKAVSICHGEIQKRVKFINMEIPKDLPKIYVDPDILEQVLVNLLINAAQASDKAESWIQVKVGTDNKDLNGAIIEVIDNGCGMDEEIRERVFDPFFTTKPSESGTGLGLSLCQNMIDAIGGSIEVESEPEAGSTFRIRLKDSSNAGEDGYENTG